MYAAGRIGMPVTQRPGRPFTGHQLCALLDGAYAPPDLKEPKQAVVVRQRQPPGLEPTRGVMSSKYLFYFQKTNPGNRSGRGRSAAFARTGHGVSRPRVAGSMACYLRVISRVQVSGTVTSRAKQPGGERGQLSGSPFEQKVGSVLGENPPDLAATPADTAINPSSPPFARSPKYPGIRRRRRHHPGAGGWIRHLGIIRSPASACQ